MKKRDIVILIISFATIAVSVFFMLRMLFPPADSSTLNEEANAIPTVPSTLDDSAYQKVENLSDYGQVDLANLGKKDLFSGF